MKKFLRKPKEGAQPEDEDSNRGALFGNRTAAAPPPYSANSNPYAPERGGGGRGGYGAPQVGYGAPRVGYGRSNGGYGDAPNPYSSDVGNSQRQYPNEQSAEADDEEVIVAKEDIRRTKDNSVKSLNNALDAARRAEESGIATIGRLGTQAEHLSNTEKNLDHASLQNRIAGEKASELKKQNRSMFVPAMGNPLRSSARVKEEEARILAHQKSDREEREKTREFSYDGRSSVGRALNDTGRVESRATTSLAERSRYQFEADESDDEKETVIANNLDQLGAITGRLKGLAMATSAEVDRQNVQIERIMKKSDRVDDQIAINHNRIRKIH